MSYWIEGFTIELKTRLNWLTMENYSFGNDFFWKDTMCCVLFVDVDEVIPMNETRVLYFTSCKPPNGSNPKLDAFDHIMLYFIRIVTHYT